MKHATLFAAVLGLGLGATARADGDAVLRKGDRVVFYGDSITEQRLYTCDIEQYFACRSPDLDLRFFNAGWGGDTVPGAKARLDRDVMELKPTVVTLFFGMNDGGYQAKNDAVVATYRSNLTDLVKTLKGKGVRVVVFGPGCCDGVRNPKLGAIDYDGMLEALTQAAGDVAKAEGCTFGDVFHPMRDFLAARRKEDPGTAVIPDGVHPDAEGHLVVAHAMLRALGAEPMAPLGEVDVKSAHGKGLKVTSNTADEIVLTTTAPVALPYGFDASQMRTMRESGLLDELAGQRLTVTGLSRDSWYVVVDDSDAVQFSSAELARGVAWPGSASARARLMRDLVAKKENNYYQAWRNVRLGLADVGGADKAYAGLLALDDGFHALIRARAAPTTTSAIHLTPAPSGQNVALHCKYEASDPNAYQWGVDGLTDGSWESDAAHCFATGDAAAFPKTVTVDLGAAADIAAVKIGVPEFGSTRHIAVAWSEDKKEFTPLATIEFAQSKRATRTLVFAPVHARFVRITYLDHWPSQVQYAPTFCFTSECEVYGAK